MKKLPWIIVALLAVVCAVLFVSARQNAIDLNTARRKYIDTTDKLIAATAANLTCASNNAALYSSLTNAATANTTLLSNNAALYAKLTNAVAIVNAQNVRIALKPLPLKVGARAALAGDGGVLQIKSTGDDALAVTVTIKRGDKTKDFDLVINANALKEIGHSEGWAFVKGDLIEITAPGYVTMTAKF